MAKKMAFGGGVPNANANPMAIAAAAQAMAGRPPMPVMPTQAMGKPMVGMKTGGSVSRGDGCAIRGKTKGRYF